MAISLEDIIRRIEKIEERLDFIGTESLVHDDKLETISRKNILTPIISDFSYAQHSHDSPDSGGELGTGSVTEDNLSLSDVTTWNVNASRHGFCPKAPNDTTKFLRGDATWSALPSASNTFLDLTDTPSSYSGQALKNLVVNSSASGLIFTDSLISEYVEIYDDFIYGTIDTTNYFYDGNNSFYITGTIELGNVLGGVIRFLGNSSHVSLSSSSLTGFSASKNPVFEVRTANVGTTSGGVTRIGFGSAFLTADPTNGIFFRYTRVGGNYIAVCRSGGSETTLDTTVASSTSFVVLRMEITSSSVAVYVNGVHRGNITQNIPTANMLFSMGNGSSNNLNSGADIDAIYIRQRR